MKKRRVWVLHGPNLNLLGTRETSVYGELTLRQINQRIRTFAKGRVLIQAFQSNSEGRLIDLIQQSDKSADGVVINPAAYTHYSYAIRDAIAAISIPVVEVHLSDIRKREPFRRKSVISAVCVGQVHGLGWKSYCGGIEILERKWMQADKLAAKNKR